MSIRLDERVVKATPAATKGAVLICDDEITGFGLRVFAPTRRDREGRSRWAQALTIANDKMYF